MRLGLKCLALLLLLVLLVLCSSVQMCDARTGKHWRRNRAPSTSLVRRKGKAKSSGSNKQNSKGNQNPYQPSLSTSPNVPVSPSRSSPRPPSPQSITAPTQSQDTVFNVVDFGAKGDGVTDDTQVIIVASKVLCICIHILG
jgi:hypothetical protein